MDPEGTMKRADEALAAAAEGLKDGMVRQREAHERYMALAGYTSALIAAAGPFAVEAARDLPKDGVLTPEQDAQTVVLRVTRGQCQALVKAIAADLEG
jgi:hypothetical protein